MTNGNLMGLDPSLTASGFCVMPVHAPESPTIGVIGASRTHNATGVMRLGFIRNAVDELVREHSVRVVAMEGIAFGSKDPYAMERAGLVYILALHLYESSVPFFLVNPSTLKKLVTGKGNSKKEDMKLAVYKRWGFEHDSNDVVDAYALARALRGHVRGHERQADEAAWRKVQPGPFAKGDLSRLQQELSLSPPDASPAREGAA